MTFIRAKEIPPKSGNWYDYEVKTTREDKHVRQKVVRYIGKASADHIPHGGSSVSIATPVATLAVDNTHITKMKTPARRIASAMGMYYVVRPDSLPDVDYKVSLHKRKSVKVGNSVVDATLIPITK